MCDVMCDAPSRQTGIHLAHDTNNAHPPQLCTYILRGGVRGCAVTRWRPATGTTLTAVGTTHAAVWWRVGALRIRRGRRAVGPGQARGSAVCLIAVVARAAAVVLLAVRLVATFVDVISALR